MSAPQDEPRITQEPRQVLLEKHTAVLLTAASIAYLALALLIAAKGNASTALAILDESGSLNVAIAVAVRTTPLAMGLGYIWITVRPSATYTETRLQARVLLLAGMAFLADWFLTLVVVLVPIFVNRVLPWTLKRLRHEPLSQSLDQWLASISILVVPTFFPASMWLPAQQLSLDDGSVTVGYILSLEDDTFAVLENKSRHVTFVPSENVTDRRICSTGGESRSLLALVAGKRFWEPYPVCPDA